MEWRDVIGFEGAYRVSSGGMVMSVERMVPSARHPSGQKRVRERTLRNWNSMGYDFVTLYGAQSRKVAVHVLVAETFIGPRPLGADVRHLDGNPTNNCVGNLCYGSRKENASDTVAHGRTTKGERNARAKLTAEQVAGIKDAILSGARGVDIARSHKVSPQAICDIKNGRNWAHIQNDISGT